VKLDWGRSGGFLRSRPSRLQIAEKTIDYPKFAGRWPPLRRHFSARAVLRRRHARPQGFERIDVAQHFGLRYAEISALTGKELQREYLLRKSERFRKRALCALFAKLAPWLTC
jgi:hypothetical protein